MSFDKGSCVLPWDTNRTLKATFKFLKEHEINEDGSKNITRIYLGIASLDNINLQEYKVRNNVFNLIEGTIIDVLDDAVVISVPFKCEVLPFVVAYSDIENIQNNSLIKYRVEYLAYMDKLGELYKCEGNRYYDILESLKFKLYINKGNVNLDFVIIYGGIFSESYKANQIKVVKNLILINFGIIPITAVTGYFTTPIKEGK